MFVIGTMLIYEIYYPQINIRLKQFPLEENTIEGVVILVDIPIKKHMRDRNLITKIVWSCILVYFINFWLSYNGYISVVHPFKALCS